MPREYLFRCDVVQSERGEVIMKSRQSPSQLLPSRRLLSGKENNDLFPLANGTASLHRAGLGRQTRLDQLERTQRSLSSAEIARETVPRPCRHCDRKTFVGQSF